MSPSIVRRHQTAKKMPSDVFRAPTRCNHDLPLTWHTSDENQKDRRFIPLCGYSTDSKALK
jgi:hypothetical protein